MSSAPTLEEITSALEALEAELSDRGYFYLASRASAGHFLALRFNLEEAPEMQVDLCVDNAAAPLLGREQRLEVWFHRRVVGLQG